MSQRICAVLSRKDKISSIPPSREIEEIFYTPKKGVEVEHLNRDQYEKYRNFFDGCTNVQTVTAGMQKSVQDADGVLIVDNDLGDMDIIIQNLPEWLQAQIVFSDEGEWGELEVDMGQNGSTFGFTCVI